MPKRDPFPFPEHLRPKVRVASSNPNLVVTVIAGPSGSGKTTLANKKRAWGHLVIDVDALFVALSGLPWFDKPANLLPFVLDARDAVINRLARGGDCRAWVITANGDMREVAYLARRLRASIIVLAVDRSECMRRIRNDPQRLCGDDLYGPIIDDWWKKYENTRHELPPDTEILT